MAPKPTTVSAADKLRQERREALLRRTRQGQAVLGGARSYFKQGLEGVSFWSPKEGEHTIDILPYTAGPNDPFVVQNKLREGDPTYLLQFWIHRDVGGIEDQSMLCLAKCYNKPCPICEHRRTLQKDGADEDLIKSLQPSRYPRVVYNVIVYDSDKDEAAGVQVFETSSYLMELYLDKLSKAPTRGGARPRADIVFSDPDEGKSICFERTGKRETTKYIGHRFEERNYTISQELLDSVHCLDELLYIPTYEEVRHAYWGDQAPETEMPQPDEPAPAPARSRRGPAVAPPAEAEEPPPDEAEAPSEAEEPEPGEPSLEEVLAGMDRAQLKAYITEQNLPIVVYKEKPDGKFSDDWIRGAILAQVDTADAESAAAGDPAPAPAPAPAKAPPKPTPKADGKQTCPAGGVFGQNLNELQDCEVCTNWDECLAENERISAAKQAATKRTAPPATPKRGAPARK